MITSAQVVETSFNSLFKDFSLARPFQDYTHIDDHKQSTYVLVYTTQVNSQPHKVIFSDAGRLLLRSEVHGTSIPSLHSQATLAKKTNKQETLFN